MERKDLDLTQDPKIQQYKSNLEKYEEVFKRFSKLKEHQTNQKPKHPPQHALQSERQQQHRNPFSSVIKFFGFSSSESNVSEHNTHHKASPK